MVANACSLTYCTRTAHSAGSSGTILKCLKATGEQGRGKGGCHLSHATATHPPPCILPLSAQVPRSVRQPLRQDAAAVRTYAHVPNPKLLHGPHLQRPRVEALLSQGHSRVLRPDRQLRQHLARAGVLQGQDHGGETLPAAAGQACSRAWAGWACASVRSTLDACGCFQPNCSVPAQTGPYNRCSNSAWLASCGSKLRWVQRQACTVWLGSARPLVGWQAAALARCCCHARSRLLSHPDHPRQFACRLISTRPWPAWKLSLHPHWM